MQVFQVTQPGMMPVKTDNIPDMDMMVMLELSKANFIDATLALHLFNEAYNTLRGFMKARLEAEDTRAHDITGVAGIPKVYLMQAPHLHARSFLYALDTFQVTMKKIGEMPNAPDNMPELLSEFDAAFPSLRGVRNSAHHTEDRIRREAHGKAIIPQKEAGSTSFVGGMQLNMLSGNRYGNTLADGSYGEIEVSETSMSTLTALYQKLLDSINWLNPHADLSFTIPS